MLCAQSYGIEMPTVIDDDFKRTPETTVKSRKRKEESRVNLKSSDTESSLQFIVPCFLIN